MIESLLWHSSEDCTVYVLLLDSQKLNIRFPETGNHRVIVVMMETFMVDTDLFGVSDGRTYREWCWTLASQFTEFVGKEEITYLDADLFFFSDPKQIFDEIGNLSIGIIPHRFEGPKIAQNGKYNVSWVTFKGEVGQRCLSRWAEQCRAWCFYRVETGRFADQKYLDEWPSLYGDEVCEIRNIGAGTAPWNLQQYRVTEGPCVDGKPIIFYHFHEYQSPEKLTNYKLRPEDKRLIYAPYIEALKRIKATA